MGSLNGAPEVSAKEAGLRVAIRRTLRDHKVDAPENRGLHEWWCVYRGCDHFEELVTDLVKAVLR